MNSQVAQNYLRTRVLTATPEQLQMMLYDGAIRFTDQARVGLQNKDWETSYNMISRAQKIITELICSLKRDLYPELCDRLLGLYNYVFRKLVEANVDHNVEALDEALRILRFQRDSWAMLLDQLTKQKAGDAAKKLDVPGPHPQMEASISMQG